MTSIRVKQGSVTKKTFLLISTGCH